MTSGNLLRLADALSLMESATAPFSIKTVRANVSKQTGGEWLTLEGVWLSGHVGGNRQRPAAAAPAPAAATEAKASKNPRHYKNATRNFVCAVTGNVTKVHLFLITRFNGREITL